MLIYIDKLKEKLINVSDENKTLNEQIETLKQENKGVKKKLHSLLKINNEIEIGKDQNTYTNTFWTNE
jgi:FtsZ-binding cell division protein ZapB